MEKFRNLGIIEPILKSIQEQKFVEPSEIQEKSIPLILAGKDVIAEAATGSGKTLAFAAGVIRDTEKTGRIQSLILTPTRELAEQVSDSIKRFSKHKHLEITPIYGGLSINPQIERLRITDVVVGTPGRILDHLERRTISFSNVRLLVLDEADRMLDMGFKDDVERIIRNCPGKRQTLLFSATISHDIAVLAKKYMKDPILVSAKNYVDPSKLTQFFYDVPSEMKFSLLVHLLKNEKSGMAMVFCNTKHNTDFVAKNLKYNGVNALAIHGGHSQEKRSNTMDLFNAQKANILVCTDVAARGLDIPGVTHVYNYDIPKCSKDYIHRIGRTARAGKEGKAVSIVSRRDYENFNSVLEDSSLHIKAERLPDFPKVRVVLFEDSRRDFRRPFNRNSRYGGHSNRRRY